MPIYTAPIRDLQGLQRYREDILSIAEKYGVTNIRVFGSVARGEANQDSDLDLLVTLTKPLGWEYARLERKLSEQLNIKVQLVSDNALNSHIGVQIINEARPI